MGQEHSVSAELSQPHFFLAQSVFNHTAENFQCLYSPDLMLEIFTGDRYY